ncbi:MAG: hypothetical protein AAGC78_10415 [Cellvibrio sp.]|uniref:hypothetical protein n=1 Tax=Cellvibrio sp. TaxID=1965322 RepID=UPI0031ACAA9C
MVLIDKCSNEGKRAMITTKMILDLLKEKLGSDYKTAKALEMPTQRVYQLRHKGGSLTDAQGLQAAQILEFPAESIILSLAAERSMNSPAYQILLDVADKFDPRKIAAISIIATGTLLATFDPILQTLHVV